MSVQGVYAGNTNMHTKNSTTSLTQRWNGLDLPNTAGSVVGPGGQKWAIRYKDETESNGPGSLPVYSIATAKVDSGIVEELYEFTVSGDDALQIREGYGSTSEGITAYVAQFLNGK